MKEDEVILTFAELSALLNLANEDLGEFILKKRVTRGRPYRNRLRVIRDKCKLAIDSSLEYEKELRQKKKNKKQ